MSEILSEYNIGLYLSLVIAILAFLISTISFSYKYKEYREHKRGDDSTAHSINFLPELFYIVTGFLVFMIGVNFNSISYQLNNTINDLRSDILEVRTVRLFEKPDSEVLSSVLHRSVQDIWDNIDSPIAVHRIITAPISLPGYSSDRDQVISRHLPSIGNLRAYYLFGVEMEQTENRRRMLEFIFYYLTDPIWESIEFGNRLKIRIFEIERRRSIQGWVISSPNGIKVAGEFYTIQETTGIPTFNSVLVTEEDNIGYIFHQDFEWYNELSNNLIANELEKEFHEQNPIMIFYDLNSSSLMPMSLESLITRWNEYRLRWEHDSGNSPLTSRLNELETLINTTRDKR